MDHRIIEQIAATYAEGDMEAVAALADRFGPIDDPAAARRVGAAWARLGRGTDTLELATVAFAEVAGEDLSDLVDFHYLFGVAGQLAMNNVSALSHLHAARTIATQLGGCSGVVDRALAYSAFVSGDADVAVRALGRSPDLAEAPLACALNESYRSTMGFYATAGDWRIGYRSAAGILAVIEPVGEPDRHAYAAPLLHLLHAWCEEGFGAQAERLLATANLGPFPRAFEADALLAFARLARLRGDLAESRELIGAARRELAPLSGEHDCELTTEEARLAHLAGATDRADRLWELVGLRYRDAGYALLAAKIEDERRGGPVRETPTTPWETWGDEDLTLPAAIIISVPVAGDHYFDRVLSLHDRLETFLAGSDAEVDGWEMSATEARIYIHVADPHRTWLAIEPVVRQADFTPAAAVVLRAADESETLVTVA